MEGILRVTPEKLIQSSGEFEQSGAKIKGLTSEMLSLVKSLNSVWEGEAASAYSMKFDALSGDMEKMHRMIREHVQDLQEMAKHYQSAESGNLEQGNALVNGIIA